MLRETMWNHPPEDRETGHYPPTPSPHWWGLPQGNELPGNPLLFGGWGVSRRKLWGREDVDAGAGGGRLWGAGNRLRLQLQEDSLSCGIWGSANMFTYSHLTFLMCASKVLDQIALKKNHTSGSY